MRGSAKQRGLCNLCTCFDFRMHFFFHLLPWGNLEKFTNGISKGLYTYAIGLKISVVPAQQILDGILRKVNE